MNEEHDLLINTLSIMKVIQNIEVVKNYKFF